MTEYTYRIHLDEDPVPPSFCIVAELVMRVRCDVVFIYFMAVKRDADGYYSTKIVSEAPSTDYQLGWLAEGVFLPIGPKVGQ